MPEDLSREIDQAFNECACWMNDPFEMVQFDMFIYASYMKLHICKSIVKSTGITITDMDTHAHTHTHTGQTREWDCSLDSQ